MAPAMKRPAAVQPEDAKAKAANGDSNEVVILEYQELVEGKDLSAKIAKAYGPGGLGICGVRHVPGLQEVRRKLLPLAHRLATLPQETLESYERADAHYCVGWSRGREKFKGKPDMAKGSFYANPVWDDPAGGDETVREKYPYAATRNIWPKEVPGLEEAFKATGKLVYECGEHLVKHCDRFVQSQHPEHGERLHAAAYTNSRMLAGRLLHYFSPSEGNNTEDAWCGWHNDNSVITGLVPAMWLYEDTGEEVPAGSVSSTGGLHVRGRDRSILRVALPSDCLGFQIGEASHILSGGTLVATPHQVRSHERKEGERPVCRETFALFIEPQWDAAIAPPKGVGYDAVLKEEESELIPPLSNRLKRTPPDVTPVVFGEYLADSFQEYYKHNN